MPTPREAELYKDKIEVSLDGRQIFYLFFGGAVIVGLVFVLGVMVGRRVEARGHLDHARTAAAVDPLAALDRLEGNGAMSFQTALTGNSATTDVERKIAELEKAHGKGDGKAGAKGEAKPASAKQAEAKQAEAKQAEDKKAEAKKVEAKQADAKKVEDKKPETKQAEAPKADAKPAEDKKVTQAAKVDGDKKAEGDKQSEAKKVDAKPKKDAEVAAADDAKPKFTLQLSSFQDKNEADAFLSSLKASGYQAYVTEANVSGKGTFYRVRLGTYRSMEAATTAKADFEKSSKKTASIMRL